MHADAPTPRDSSPWKAPQVTVNQLALRRPRRTALCLYLALTWLTVTACAPATATAQPSPLIADAARVSQTADTTEAGTVRVTGRASQSVAVDRARLVFGVETEAARAADAAALNARQMEATIAAVREALGDDAELSTRDYQLNPVYGELDRGSRQRAIVGYRATHALAVVADDLERVGSVIDAAVAAGANRVTSLSFESSAARAARLAAIDEATARAAAEAEMLASALGARLGAPLEVSVSPESSGSAPIYRSLMLEAAEAATPVEPGPQQVEVVVTLVYRLHSAVDSGP